MYTKYFGLKEKPFSIAPDPRYLYMSELHREALAHLLYGISGDGCFILLTGDVGTGKTTVCRCLLAQLPENTDVALIVNPRLTVLELLETICDELEIPITDDEKSVKSHIDKLNVYLLEAHAKGRNIALLIDEAQNLSLDLLEQLRLLTNLETDKKKLLKIVLLGQTELRQILSQDGAAQISQRITSRYHLLPLDRDNSFAYIHHRLAVAGEREKIFTKAALARIFEFSQGIPRLINVLCDRALLGTYVEEKYMVNGSIVNKAAREVLGSSDEEDQKQRAEKQSVFQIALAVILFLLGIGVASYYYNNSRRAPLKNDSGAGVSAEEVASVQIQTEKVTMAIPEQGEIPVVVESQVEDEQEEPKKEQSRIRIVPLEISE
jgi:general secretion pathway protein A